jgi:hypothetical protein
MRSFSLIPGLVLLLPLVAAGEVRKWNDNTGKHAIEAEFIELSETTVQLKRADGKVISVPMDRLALDDQVFALRSARLSEAAPPPLSPQGRAIVTRLVKQVRQSAAANAPAELDWQSLETVLAPANRVLADELAGLIKQEGRRSAVSHAFSELLKDKSPAVKAVALHAASEARESAAGATPAMVVALYEESEFLRLLASQSLSQVAAATDAVLPALVQTLEAAKPEEITGVPQAIRAITFAGPHVEGAAPRLAALVTDDKQPRHRRVAAAYALAHVLGLLSEHMGVDPRLRPAQFQTDYQSLIEKRQRSQGAIVREVSASLAAALKAMEDSELAGITLAALIRHGGEALQEVPADKLIALFEKTRAAEYDNDLFFGLNTPLEMLENAAAGVATATRIPADKALVLLSHGDPRMRELGAGVLSSSPEETRKLFPQLARLVKQGTSPEVRLLALQVLTHPAFNQEQDSSWLPSIAVKVKADGAIELAGRKLTGTDQLAKAVAAQTPKEPTVPAFDLERLLKDAANDSDQNLVFHAVQALAARGTESSRAILQDLARTAVASTTRQSAQFALGERGAEFGAPRPAPGVESPFAGGDAAKLRSAVVQLEMDGALNCDQALPILAAALEGNVRAVSLSLTGKDPSAMRFEFYSAEMPPSRSPYVQLKLSGPLAASPSPLAYRQIAGRPWTTPPSLAAVQFHLSCQLFQTGYEQPVFHGDLRGQTPAPWTSALPHLASIECSESVSIADCCAALTAVGHSPDALGVPRDMLQWIRLSVGDRAMPIWYVNVVPGRVLKE